MRLISTLRATTLFLLSAIVVQPVPKGESTVKGVVTDIADGRVTKAAVTFESNGQNLQTTTGADGTYSMRLEPGTYTMFIGHVGFCRARRAAFVVRKHSDIQFDFQLWICPRPPPARPVYKELADSSHTELGP